MASVRHEKGFELVLQRFHKFYPGKILTDFSKSGDFLRRYNLPLQMKGDVIFAPCFFYGASMAG
jgi:hypothetical protein